MKSILRRAFFLASKFEYPYVGTEHLVYALLESESVWVNDILLEVGIEKKKAMATLEAHLNFDHFPQLARMLDFPDHLMNKGKNAHSDATPFLNQFTTDLAKSCDSFETLVGREAELERMTQILSRKNKNNPLLIGEPGVGKTAIVAALARRIEKE